MIKKKGFIYILSNPFYPDDVLKIGKTIRKPSMRAWVLYEKSTGVPDAFHVAHQRLVEDCHQAEILLHERLKEHRINIHREFFRVSLVEAKNKLNQVVLHINKNREYHDEVVRNEKVLVVCTSCKQKNRVPMYALELSPKCGRCRAKLTEV